MQPTKFRVAVGDLCRFLLVLSITLICANPALSQLENIEFGEVRPTPVLKHNQQDVATVLVADINNRAAHGRYLNIKPEIGLLKSTARTFIQDGIKTEYVTKVIGTTIDNGQYVQLLTTTSRVLYNNPDNLQTKTVNQNSIDFNDDSSFLNSPPSSPFLHNVDSFVPGSPYLVFPNRNNRNQHEIVNNNNVVFNDNENEESEIQVLKAEKLVDAAPRFELPQPNKVVPEANLPTYTVSHDGPIFHAAAAPSPSPRVGKVFTYEQEIKAESENKILPSVTYFGFADFTTTVGDTVIIFSPSTAKPQIDAKDHITSIKGEPTLNIKPTSTKQQHITFESAAAPTKPAQVSQEPRFTPKVIETTALPTLPTTPKYKEIPSTTEQAIETTTEDIPESTEEDDEDDEEDSTTPVPPTEPPKIRVQVVGVARPDSIESSQTSQSSVAPSFSKPSNEDVLKILASLNQKQVSESSSESSVIDTSPVVTADEPETRILTGSSIIFFDDITTPKAPAMTTESEDSDEEEDDEDETTSGAQTTTTEKSIKKPIDDLLVKPLTPKPEAEIEVHPTGCVSTSLKTLSYKTTFYIPVDDVITTTSVKTNKVVTSSVVPVDCSIKPSAVTTEKPAASVSAVTEQKTDSDEDVEDESEKPTTVRITTTTENTKNTTISDNETTLSEDEDETTKKSVEATTKSVDTTKKSSEKKEQNTPVYIPETTTMEVVTESSNIDEETTVENTDEDDIEVIYKTLYTTYTYLTTFFQESTTSVSSRKDVVTNIITSTINANDFASLLSQLEPTKAVDGIEPTAVSDVGIGRPTAKFIMPVNNFIGVNLLLDSERIDYTPALSDDDVINSEIKTLYTTYTYFTTLFNEGKSEVASRTEVYTNIINPSSSLSNILQKDLLETKFVYDAEKDNNQLVAADSTKEAKKLKFEGVINGNEIRNEGEKYSTLIRSGSDLQSSGVEEGDWDDVKTSTSDGERSFVENIDRRNWNYEVDDQISSESNTEEGIPSPTLLLQTRYTTFTYYTTVFADESSSNIVSRLETLTNVVTETLSPTQVQKLDDATVPVTYFTTFTYWTTFYKDGTTKTTSREETVSNVVTPSVNPSSVDIEKALATSVVGASSADVLLVAPLQTVKAESENATSTSAVSKTSAVSAAVIEKSIAASPAEDHNIEATPVKALDPSTYFTTYTYYTTNYVGDETVIISRFETESNVVTPTVEAKQGKAIDVNGAKGNSLDGGKNNLEKTAQKDKVAVVEVTPALPEKKLLPTGVVSINHGKVIEADGISTTHFTTQAIGTYIDNLYAEVIESSSSIEIDEIRKSIQPTESEVSAAKHHKTGLVRLIDGTIVNKNATTLYESKVIGTFIDGRYAQVIESTSSIIAAKQIDASAVDNRVNIEPTAAIGNVISTSQLINPTAPVLEGSISDTVKDGDDEEDEDSKGTFGGKKKGFTPVIRPFGSSRSRPSFNPKKKSSSSGPAIITPTGITPTIKATAVKTADASSRRPGFSGPRRSSGSVSGFSPSASSSGSFGGSSSRRSFVRPTSVRASIQPSSSIRASKSSLPPRIIPTSALGARRPALRSSLNVSARPSSVLPSINRSRIRPSATLEKTTSQATQTTSDPDEFETTLVTENPSDEFESESQEPVTTTTTENSRRIGNPLLRPRRPPFTGARGNAPSTTPRSVTITTRRSPLGRTSRGTSSTTTSTPAPRTTRNRSLLRPSLPPVVISQNRPRPSSGNLFPPRGLLQKTTTQASQQIDEEDEESDSSEDYVEYQDTNTKEVKAVAPKKRSKRQTDYGTRSPGYNPRFKRPTTSRNSRSDYYTYDSEELIVTESPKTRATSRYNPRSRSTSDRPPSNSKPKIKPTTSTSQNNRLLFTLRDKDIAPSVTSRSSSFRRPGTKNYNSNSNRKTAATTRASTSKFRNYGQDTYASPRSGTSSSRGRTTNRGRVTTRGTGRLSRPEVDPAYLPKNDGTITVTHHIPTEVTIPVVVGLNTEYKQVITAKLSTEILGPKQYSTNVGNNGIPTTVILEEKTVVNGNGLTEITQYLLSETPTTSIIFTPTTIRGRKTSFSHVIPSTVYDAHPVVSTIQPQGLSNNAPLANILLSQLLLGNIGFPQQQQQQAYNPLLGIQQQPQNFQQQNFQQPQIAATPVTEFKTRTTTYVTTLHEGKSTVVPITFRGSKIYTTISDDRSMVITATEFITDTIVITPTQIQQQQPQLNSLLLPLLLQQQNQQQQINPLQNINTLPNSFDILNREALESLSLGDDKQIQSVTKDEIQQNSKEEDYEDEKVEVKPAKKPKFPKAPTPPPKPDKKLTTSVITLYISGRKPGEFSTVLSTVISENPIYKRSAPYVDVKASDLPNLDVLEAEASDNYFEYVLAGSSNDINAEPLENNQETESLEFVLGDHNKFTSSVVL